MTDAQWRYEVPVFLPEVTFIKKIITAHDGKEDLNIQLPGHLIWPYRRNSV